MSADVAKVTLTEDYRDKNGEGPVWTYKPDFLHTVSQAQAEFTYKASLALSEFRKQWIADHEDDAFAKGLEMDYIPVLTDGMMMGFMVISEIDGATYEFAPTETVEPK
jgi:hypothetical protein